MPKLKITLGNDGLFHARVFASPGADGTRPSKRIKGRTRREVEDKAQSWLDDVEGNRDIYRLTLKAAAEKYIEHLTTKRKPISPSTHRLYHSYLRNYFVTLHDVPIFDITEEMIQDEIYELELKVSGKTIANIVNFYVPCIHFFRRGFKPDLDLPEKEDPDIKVPDMNDLRTKISTIDNKRLLLPVLLGAYCGMRRSEIAALNLHEDIEYDVKIPVTLNGTTEFRYGGFIHVKNAVVRGVIGYETKGTKSKAGTRTVFVPDWLNDKLKEFRDDSEFVPYPPHKISSRFAEWAERENINCSFHGLRHFYASLGAALNIPDLYMMQMMGHATTNTLDQYKEIMSAKEAEVNETMFMYLNNNSPFAPISAPRKNINEDKERKTHD